MKVIHEWQELRLLSVICVHAILIEVREERFESKQGRRQR